MLRTVYSRRSGLGGFLRGVLWQQGTQGGLLRAAPTNSTLVGVDYVRVRLTIERCTKSFSLGDSDSPIMDPEVGLDAEAFENCHCTNPDHGQGAFASSWRAGSEQD